MEFLGRAVGADDPAARHRDRARPVGRGEGPRDAPIAVPSALLGALVPIGTERCRQLLGKRDI